MAWHRTRIIHKILQKILKLSKENEKISKKEKYNKK